MNNDAIIKRIRKVLQLAYDNQDENERRVALLQAHKMMAKYNIELDAVHLSNTEAGQQAPNYTYKQETSTTKGCQNWRKLLSPIIAQNFRCENYGQDDYCVFFGRELDARIACETYDCAAKMIHQESTRLYKQARRLGLPSQGVVNSYALGFLKGLREGLEQQSQALMVVVPGDVQQQYKELSEVLGLKTSTCRVSASRADANAYNRGMHDGKHIMNGRRIGA